MTIAYTVLGIDILYTCLNEFSFYDLPAALLAGHLVDELHHTLLPLTLLLGSFSIFRPN